MTACAAPVKPTWQQELENIDRQWSEPEPVKPVPAKVTRPRYGLSLILQGPEPVEQWEIQPIKGEVCDWRAEY
jgi:hypothetical protein